VEKLTFIVTSAVLLLCLAWSSARPQFIQKGDLFSDNFDGSSTEIWQDMKVWGFGAWQVRDGAFVSLDSSNLNQQIFAAIPKFDRAFVKRDFSTMFRLKPVAGGQFLFTIGVRQQGWSDYKFEISGDGVITIKKAKVGALPEALFISRPGQIVFGDWQWVRLDVRGEKPVSFKMKIWQGQQMDEPEFYNAVALDPHPLEPTSMGCSISMIQDGGAHAYIDDFNVYSNIRPSKLWRWAEGHKKIDALTAAKAHFLQGELFLAESALRALLAQPDDLASIHNNLAIIQAEKNRFDASQQHIADGLRVSPNSEALQHNALWIWYNALRQGLLAQQGAEDFPMLFVKTDRTVYRDAEELTLTAGAFRDAFGSVDATLPLTISAHDSSGKRAFQWSKTISAKKATVKTTIELAGWPDGKYEFIAAVTSADGQSFKSTAQVEIIRHRFDSVHAQFRKLEAGIAAAKNACPPGIHRNDLASLDVKLLPLKKLMLETERPGYLALFEDTLNKGLAEIDSLLQKMVRGENPFRGQPGNFLRGYDSEIDGSLQGYALWVPEAYTPDARFPLVINLHGYDPGFAPWHDNQFLPSFMPHATNKGRYILVNPFGRGNTMYQNIGEHDVLTVMGEVQRLYSIDEDRIYLTGGSMGGAGTWHIGLAFPDTFAAIAPIMGPTEYAFWTGLDTTNLSPLRRYVFAVRSALDVAENAGNLPMRCNHGALDDIVPVEQSRKMVARLKPLGYDVTYIEHPTAQHGGFDPQMEYDNYDWFEDKRREAFPSHVVYKTATLKHNSAYWIEIVSFSREGAFASIDAEIIDRSAVRIRTENVAQFSVMLNEALVDRTLPIKFTIDDRAHLEAVLSSSDTIRFQATLQSDGSAADWALSTTAMESGLVKTNATCGPMQDVYNSGFMLVLGTTGSKKESSILQQEAASFSDQWEDWQHASCRMKKDFEVTEEDQARFNLILFGGPNSNSVTRRMAPYLPIQFSQKKFRASSRTFDDEQAGVAFIYPNPTHRNRYVLVYAGNSWQALEGVVKRIGAEFDYVVFDERTTGLNFHQGNLTVDGSPLLYGFFDRNWQFHPTSQWSADDAVRSTIKSRRVMEAALTETDDSPVFLSDFKPNQVDQWTGLAEMDRTYWGRELKTGADKGIGVMPNSELIYTLDGSWSTLSGALAVDVNPMMGAPVVSDNGSTMQFAVYGDDDEIFVSQPMSSQSKAQEFSVPVSGVKELRLVLRTQDWLPNLSQSGSWLTLQLKK